VRVLLATDPSSPDWPNEDFAAAAPGLAVLLDGAGSPGGQAGGCGHGVAWFARTLGGLITAGARDLELPLDKVLSQAIEQVRMLHADSCDLSHPASPSATVLIVRQAGKLIEYLVLGDSVLLLWPRAGQVGVISDARLGELGDRLRSSYEGMPNGLAERRARRRDYLSRLDAERNKPTGYWIAAADPAAAQHAITGTEAISSLSAIALLSDGAGRLVDRYHQASWAELAAIVTEHGPAELIRRVRATEAGDADGRTWPRSKLRDDATVLYWPLDPVKA
jgi:protein phosphatase 2C-like protein